MKKATVLLLFLNLSIYYSSTQMYWGNVVYESENYDNGWDGGDLHDGVYTYLYYTDTKDSSAPIEHGFVHITR